MIPIRSLFLLFVVCSTIQACGSERSSARDAFPAADSKAVADAPAFSGEKVRLVGRFDLGTDGRARFTWPGSAMEFRFEGTSAGIRIASDERVRFLVEIDGREKDLWIRQGDHFYQLATDLKAAAHAIRLTRLSESFSGVTALTSDPVVQGKLLTPPEPPGRRLLVLGDSITAGYGVEGRREACGYSLETSTPLKAYASLTARTLGADLHIIAWSGIGARRSYGEKSPENPTIIDRYPLTLADQFNSRWNPAEFQPDAVLIAIGTNDYWDGEAPGYRDAMAELLRKVRGDYAQAPVYLIVSPMLSGEVRAAQKSVLNALAGGTVTVLDLGRIDAADGYGCDYHPNTKTQSRMAGVLTERLARDLGWANSM